MSRIDLSVQTVALLANCEFGAPTPAYFAFSFANASFTGVPGKSLARPQIASYSFAISRPDPFR